MSKCKLCLKNDLEDVGSHIFPDSLIRTAIYIDGKVQNGKAKRGDYEAIFEIRETEADLEFFGASVLPEIREKIIGKAQTPEEIEKTNRNSFIDTKLVCRKCERLFNPVETEFTSKIYDKIRDGKLQIKKEKNTSYVPIIGNGYILCLLLVLINVWRASASDNNNWKVKADTEEFIRCFLSKTLKKDINSTIKAAKEHLEIVNRLSFTLHFIQQTEGKSSVNAIFIDSSIDPYMIVLNQLIILFSESSFNSLQPPKVISDVIKRDTIQKLIEQYPKELKIQFLLNEERLKLLYNFYQRQASKIMRNALELYVQGSQEMLGVFPDKRKQQYLKDRIGELANLKIGYSRDNIIYAISKVLMKDVEELKNYR